MELILWRHAEAVEGFPDLPRKLTDKGHKQAEKTAAFLQHHLPADVRILVSPAVRTQQTVAALTQTFTTVASIAPGALADTVLQEAGWPHAGGTVLVVGHQPTLGSVAAQLLGSSEPLRIKKSGLWWFSHRADANLLRLVMTPELL